MKKAVLFTFLGLSATALLFADAPVFFNYQGKLHQAGGQRAVDGSYDMVFSIYGQASGGSPLFSDTRTGAGNGVPVVDGSFSVLVGTGSLSGQPLAQVLTAGTDRWLQVTVSGTPLLPRQKLTAEAYALSVASASVGTAEILDGSVGAAQLAAGAVRTAHIPSGAVTDAKINDVSFGKLFNVPASAGGPAIFSGPTQVLVSASSVSFAAGPFISTSGPAGQVNVSLSPSVVTMKGNTFNISNSLVLLDSTGAVPSALLPGAYTGITGVGALTTGVWQGTPVAAGFGGTGGTSASLARMGLGMAGSTNTITGVLGLTGGGAMSADRTISVSTAGLPVGGCAAAGDKLVWNAATTRFECGVDLDNNTTATGGDLSGVQTAATVVGLQGRPISSTAPALNEILVWNGSLWRPQAEASPNFRGTGIRDRLASWVTVSTMGASAVTEWTSSVTFNGSLSVSGNITGGNVTSGTDPGHSHSVYASTTHVHDAGYGFGDTDFTSGILPVARGGTGRDTWPLVGTYIRALNATTLQERTGQEMISDIGAAYSTHTHPGSTPHGGISGYFPRFNGTSAVENSTIYQDGEFLSLGGGNYAAFFGAVGINQFPSIPTTHIENTSNTGTTFRVLGNFSQRSYASWIVNTETVVRADVSGGTGLNIGMDLDISSNTASSDNFGGVFQIGYDATGTADGVKGEATGAALNYGIKSKAFGPEGNANYGLASYVDAGIANYGLYATASGGSTNWAGYFDGDVETDSALSKVSGTFDIPHPDPAKAAGGWRLRHSFVESPTRGDNLYRWTVDVKGGRAEVRLPSYFKHLNENPQVAVSPRKHLGQGWGRVDDAAERVLIQADADGPYNVLVIATRKDKDARAFDAQGVEYREAKP